MNEEEVNQKFVDIVIDNFADYKLDEDMFAGTVEYIVPMQLQTSISYLRFNQNKWKRYLMTY